MCDVSSNVFSYLRRISDVRVAYLAYQWRMCYVCATFVSLLWSMCDVLGVLGIFCGVPRELNASMCMFSFFQSHGSDISHGSGCRAGFFHGYAWCSLRLCSCRLTTRMESLKMFPHQHDHHHHHHNLGFFFFGVNINYLDFSGGIFDL